MKSVVNATPWPFYTPRMTQCPLYSVLGEPKGRSEVAPKISPPPGFDHRTDQAVASRYNIYAMPPIYIDLENAKCSFENLGTNHQSA